MAQDLAPTASKGLTAEQQQELDTVFERARKALSIIETYDQSRVDRLCQAVAWAVSNKKTFTRLVKEGIEESGLGDYDSRMNKRMKILGILRDALRTKSVGIIEELPEKGIVKYAKPAGVIAGLLPVTNPLVHDGQHGHQRDQVHGRGHLLAASAEPEDRARDRARAARGAEEAGRARGSDPVPREGRASRSRRN